jgi:hypothetical protein
MLSQLYPFVAVTCLLPSPLQYQFLEVILCSFRPLQCRSSQEERRLLEYNSPFRTSQETHYFSATEPSRLMLCKIWGFHGGDYKECRLLGYKNPVRTSHETHYVYATEPSRLMVCKIWGFHGGGYEECLFGYMNPVLTSQETHYFSAT